MPLSNNITVVGVATVEGVDPVAVSVDPLSPEVSTPGLMDGTKGNVALAQEAVAPEDVADFGGINLSALKKVVFVTTATGNGTTDDTAALQADIDALSVTGGVLQLLPGTYKVTGTLNITADNIVINGVGMASHVVARGDYGDVFFFGKGDNSKMFSSGISNLWISSNITRTSGYCIYAQYTYWFIAENIRLGNSSGVVPVVSDPTPIYNGLYLQGQSTCSINKMWIYASNEAITVSGNTPAYYDYDGWMANLEIVGGVTGIRIQAGVGGITIRDSNIFQATDGMIVESGSLQLFIHSVFFDSCSNNGVWIKTGALQELQWSDVWAASNGGYGILIEANAINGAGYAASLGGAGFVIANSTADLNVGTGNTVRLSSEIEIATIIGAGTVIVGGGGGGTPGNDLGGASLSAAQVLSALSGTFKFSGSTSAVTSQFLNGVTTPTGGAYGGGIGFYFLGAAPLAGDLIQTQYGMALIITAPALGWTFTAALTGTYGLIYYTDDGGATWNAII